MNINLDELGKKLHAKLDSSIDQLKAAKAHLEDVYKVRIQPLRHEGTQHALARLG